MNIISVPISGASLSFEYKAIFTEIFTIIEKQNGNQPLSKHEVDFLCWYALHANVCTEEWGRRVRFDSFDPNIEIQRLKRLIQDGLSKQAASI